MIKSSKISAAFLCLIIFSICIIVGFFFKPMFILAGVAMAGYIWIDKRYLRCPYCGGFENLERLFYAKHHTYYCQHCGKIIIIETN